jgi:Spy/CpxP family protein refolding chaperone
MTNLHAKWPLAAVLGGLVILANGVTPSEAHRGRRAAPIERRALQSELGLTEDQVKSIKEIHTRHRDSMRETWRTLRDARRSLRDMALGDVDEATLNAKAAEVRELAGQVLEARIRTLHEVVRVLTPEQREKLRELRPLRPLRRAPIAS